jgi:solute carrier family 25 citrate transporter 1
VTAVCPSERIKTALIDDARAGGQKRFTSSIQAIKLLYQEDGLRTFYRGLPGTTLKQAGATSFRMGSYNIIKDWQNARNIEQSTSVNFANGAVAGLITTYATQPFDCIKTRSQSAHVTTTTQAIKDIYQDGGIKAFWSGTLMRLGRTIFAGGILFTTAESVSKLVEPFFVKPA